MDIIVRRQDLPGLPVFNDNPDGFDLMLSAFLFKTLLTSMWRFPLTRILIACSFFGSLSIIESVLILTWESLFMCSMRLRMGFRCIKGFDGILRANSIGQTSHWDSLSVSHWGDDLHWSIPLSSGCWESPLVDPACSQTTNNYQLTLDSKAFQKTQRAKVAQKGTVTAWDLKTNCITCQQQRCSMHVMLRGTWEIERKYTEKQHKRKDRKERKSQEEKRREERRGEERRGEESARKMRTDVEFRNDLLAHLCSTGWYKSERQRVEKGSEKESRSWDDKAWICRNGVYDVIDIMKQK